MKSYFPILLMFWHLSVTGQPEMKDMINAAGDYTKYPHDLLLIFDSTKVRVFETGLTHVDNHTLTKVLTRKGALELSVIRTGYEPLSAFVEYRKVVIHRKNGKQEMLDPAQTMDYPAPARAIYWGAREIMLGVGRLEPGDAVEVVTFRKGYTYALLQDDDEERFIPPMRGHFYDIVDFFASYPVKLKVYQVEVPRDKTLQFRFYHGESESSCILAEDHLVYTFSKKEILPVKTEPRMVAQSDVLPKLLLSTSPDWYAKSKWFYGVNEDYGSFESTPEIKAKVDEILAGAKDEWDSVGRLTHWCADEIRYSGISMGKGEGYTLHTGEMNFRDRCGVCKDKAGMLITMLRAAGFESFPAMTMAGSRIDYIPADQFNHCVTVVKMSDNKYHLLDPTWVPFIRELWSSAEQQQQYLMGLPEGADLATTDLSPAGNHFVRINGVSEIRQDGSIKGRITITGEGQSDAAIRGMFRYSNPSFWFQSVEREILRLYPHAVVTHIKYNDPMNYIHEPVWVAIDYTINDFAVVSGNKMSFIPLSAAQIFKNYQGHLFFDTHLKERKYSFRDRCTRQVEISESISLPGNITAGRIPAAQQTTGTAATFEGGYTLGNRVLEFNARATYNKRIYEPGDWPEFRSAVDAQNRFGNEQVVVTLNN